MLVMTIHYLILLLIIVMAFGWLLLMAIYYGYPLLDIVDGYKLLLWLLII
jgi:hypothetical protein